MSVQTRARTNASPDSHERETLERNKRVAREVIERIFIHQQDGAIDELVAPDFVPHTFGPMAPGREGLREGMRRAGAGVSDPKFVIHDLVAEGDLVAARLTSGATHAGTFMGVEASGRRYTIDEMHLFRLRDGWLVEHWHTFDTAHLMRQLKSEVPESEKAAS